jgi:hypothetical protein
MNPQLLSGAQRRILQYPNRGDLTIQYHVKEEHLYKFLDSEEKPIYQELVKFKQYCISRKEVCFKYWLPNPRNVDKDILDEKIITYILNQLIKEKLLKIVRVKINIPFYLRTWVFKMMQNQRIAYIFG